MGNQWLLLRLHLIFIALYFSLQKCEYVHDRCIFVISTGRSGYNVIVDALNQVDGVFIRGENNALFNDIESLHNLIKVLSAKPGRKRDAKTRYFKYIKKEKPAWFNDFSNEDADCISKYIFKYLYGSGKFDNYIVGFKEIRFRRADKPVMEWKGDHPQNWKPTHTHSYHIFVQRLEFLKSLCKQPQIVFNMRTNATVTMHSDSYLEQKDEAKFIPEVSEWILKYHRDGRG
eukprot:TRINITY_DN26809_c0_g1_i2.p1 TRINITY_DN26809_c0_g1~~TRINITY_DN26809_c0_g1_i2.p1  ORF type:complete len:262 (-),score=0.25 TRINITY_DN26809_c0_g1_i2:24-713(-)